MTTGNIENQLFETVTGLGCYGCLVVKTVKILISDIQSQILTLHISVTAEQIFFMKLETKNYHPKTTLRANYISI